MKLSRKSWIVKVMNSGIGADFDLKYGYRDNITLCALFWRTLFSLLLPWAICTVVPLALLIAMVQSLGVIGVLMLLGTLGVILLGVFTTAVTIQYTYHALTYTENPTVKIAKEAVWGWKNKVCPIITIK